MNGPIMDPVRPAGDVPQAAAVPATTQKQDEHRAIAEARKRRRQERRKGRLPFARGEVQDTDGESAASPGGEGDEVPPTVDCLA